MTGWIEGRLIARRDWAEGLATFTLDAPVEVFAPGQFINLAFEHEGSFEKRSYSIASAPGHPLELLLTHIGAGEVTPRLFSMALGERVLVSPQALGFFTTAFIPPCRDLWLVATGTGLAPFLSMLRSGLLLPLAERVVLVHGVRQLGHLVYRSELEALAENPAGRFAYLPVVSQEPPTGKELFGRVTSLLESGAVELAAGRALDDQSHVLLCGNPAMIQEVEGLLKPRGLKKHRKNAPGHYSYEKYW